MSEEKTEKELQEAHIARRKAQKTGKRAAANAGPKRNS